MSPRILTLLVCAALIPACAQTQHSAPRAASADTSPVLDGDVSEWGDAAVMADASYLYLRWSVQGEVFTPQAAGRTTTIYLDTDDNPATGRRELFQQGRPLGVDLEIELSPRDPTKGQMSRGVKLWAVGASGTRTPISASDADFSFTPTYASSWYEARVLRQASESLPKAGMRSSGRVAGVYALVDANGKVWGFSDRFETSVPAVAGRPTADIPVPAKPQDAIRVVSMNVLRGSPVNKPEPFARMLNALAPDAVLLQEWDTDDPAVIEAWFNTMVVSQTPWQARLLEGEGVAIAVRGSITPVGERVTAQDAARQENLVRFIAGQAEINGVKVLLASLHLKCCGTQGSPEDTRRMNEARAINSMLREAEGLPSVRIIGGDFNLVGSRPPLDLVRAKLDRGSDLAIAGARVLGDRAFATWADAKSEFSAGRLDFIVHSAGKSASSFVLDTARLSDAALKAAGLERDDSRASDHMPVVLDLVPRP